MTEPTYSPLPECVALMCNLMAALPDHTQLRNATLKLLAAQESNRRRYSGTDPEVVGDTHTGGQMLSIAQQVVRLNPTAKVSGIKLIRSIFSTSLRDTKLLWEVGASLQGYDTRPGRGFAPGDTTK